MNAQAAVMKNKVVVLLKVAVKKIKSHLNLHLKLILAVAQVRKLTRSLKNLALKQSGLHSLSFLLFLGLLEVGLGT
jgi:hypothetical protein